jgi:hypothetical protein
VRVGRAGPPPSPDLLAAVYAPSEVDALTVTGEGPPGAGGDGDGGPVAAAGTRGKAEAP